MSENPILPGVSGDRPVRPFHDVARLFPLMRGAAFGELVADIRKHGLREPIIVDREGRVLDGRNRYRACLQAGIEPRFIEWHGEGPLEELALSLNLHRRHLNESQRAMVAARLAKLLETEAIKRSGARTDLMANLPSGQFGPSRSKAAAQVNVSARLVQYAIKVLQSGTEQLIAAVEAGDLAVSKASILAALPSHQQALTLAHGPKRAADEARRITPLPATAATPEPSPGDFGVLPVERSHEPGRAPVRGFAFLWVRSAGLDEAVDALKGRGFRYAPSPIRATV
jgi:hypothetical protein